MKIRKLGLSLSFLLLVGCQSQKVPKGVSVQVKRVISGQTIEVFNPQTPEVVERVRLQGIDAPDWQQKPWSVVAKGRLEELLVNTDGEESTPALVFLEIESQKKDRHGRYLAYVWHNDTLVNEKLVEDGSVLAVTNLRQDKYTQRLIYAQEYARLMGLGIWNTSEPMGLTPQEFRSQN